MYSFIILRVTSRPKNTKKTTSTPLKINLFMACRWHRFGFLGFQLQSNVASSSHQATKPFFRMENQTSKVPPLSKRSITSETDRLQVLLSKTRTGREDIYIDGDTKSQFTDGSQFCLHAFTPLAVNSSAFRQFRQDNR